ncbi:MAG: 50S ribosomal protein L10 [Calditrichaeota bacterium]|nr:50S ribosomal protein L10 [Calditrichota bacterium]MCB9368595.1 50S ribosomal protein L10 [Calditrichota bacterium]
MSLADLQNRVIRPEKAAIVADFREKMERASGVYLTDNLGLSVEQMTALRRECFQNNVDFMVVKNTFSRMVLKEKGYEEILKHLEGPTAIAIGYDDGATPARILDKFVGTTDKLVVKGVIFDGKVLPASELAAIKDLPTREQALSGLVGAIFGPVQGFYNVINAVLRDFVSVVDQIAIKKEG